MDETQLRKSILKKEKGAAVAYIEDLFINNIRKDATVSALYQMAVKMAVLPRGYIGNPPHAYIQ